jgi:tRNA threonylcarbamoyladenosine biosynthesis protein TsaE
MNYTEISNNLNDLEDIIERYKEKLTNSIIFLNGELGAGKTTFVKKFVENVSRDTTASSPTFTIMQKYETSVGQIYHFDLYRIESLEELEMTGFFEYIEYEGTIFIEWGTKFDIGSFLDNFITINIKQLENGKRKYFIENFKK